MTTRTMIAAGVIAMLIAATDTTRASSSAVRESLGYVRTDVVNRCGRTNGSLYVSFSQLSTQSNGGAYTRGGVGARLALPEGIYSGSLSGGSCGGSFQVAVIAGRTRYVSVMAHAFRDEPGVDVYTVRHDAVVVKRPTAAISVLIVANGHEFYPDYSGDAAYFDDVPNGLLTIRYYGANYRGEAVVRCGASFAVHTISISLASAEPTDRRR